MDVFSRQDVAQVTCPAKRYFAINVWLFLVFPFALFFGSKIVSHTQLCPVIILFFSELGI